MGKYFKKAGKYGGGFAAYGLGEGHQYGGEHGAHGYHRGKHGKMKFDGKSPFSKKHYKHKKGRGGAHHKGISEKKAYKTMKFYTKESMEYVDKKGNKHTMGEEIVAHHMGKHGVNIFEGHVGGVGTSNAVVDSAFAEGGVG